MQYCRHCGTPVVAGKHFWREPGVLFCTTGCVQAHYKQIDELAERNELARQEANDGLGRSTRMGGGSRAF